MTPQDAIPALEAAWDVDQDGVLYRMRQGVFDEVGCSRLAELLCDIEVGQDSVLDRRFVSLIWFIPVFMRWQEERIVENGGDVKRYRDAVSAFDDVIVAILGAP